MKIGLPGKLILGDYFQENRTLGRPFLLLRISFPRKTYLYTIRPCLDFVLGQRLTRLGDHLDHVVYPDVAPVK